MERCALTTIEGRLLRRTPRSALQPRTDVRSPSRDDPADRHLTPRLVLANVAVQTVRRLMNRTRATRAERNAGAFLGPDLLVPVPMRTLSDDYGDEPAEPVDTDREPAPEPPTLVRRLLDRVARRRDGPRP